LFFRCGDLSSVDAFKGRSYLVIPKNEKLSQLQIQSLLSDLEKLPQIILQARNSEVFLRGMIESLKNEVQTILQAFEKEIKKKLFPFFKWEVHISALEIFVQEMNRRHDLWQQNNDPLYIFDSNINAYRNVGFLLFMKTNICGFTAITSICRVYKIFLIFQTIQIRLEQGFGSDAEGKIISLRLLEGIRWNAQKAGNKHQVSMLQDVDWLTNGEKVRLTYFAELAKKVQRGEKEQAMEHFRNPKKAIDNWFAKRVDAFSTENSIKEFQKIIDVEFEGVKQAVRTFVSFTQLKKFVDRYLVSVDVVSYKPKITPDDSTSFNVCQMSLLQGLDAGKLGVSFLIFY